MNPRNLWRTGVKVGIGKYFGPTQGKQGGWVRLREVGRGQDSGLGWGRGRRGRKKHQPGPPHPYPYFHLNSPDQAPTYTGRA